MYNWTQLGIAEITNLYLYGTVTKPTDLANAAMIRQPDHITPLIMDAVSFMATGPGRFANGAKSTLVINFLLGVGVPGATGVRQEFDLTQAMAMTGGSPNIPIYQFDYLDGAGDHGFRTYVYNSSGFTIAPGARFVVDADGTRHIENYAILPFDDNFDFNSRSFVAQFGNPWLQERIDPSHIGRLVDIEFDPASKEQIPRVDYGLSSYLLDTVRLANTFSPIDGVALLPDEMQSVVDSLWASGATQTISQSRAIIYGTRGSDTISGIATISDSNLADVQNGIVYVAGDGIDTVTGTAQSDILISGKGRDTLRGGAGFDVYRYAAGDGQDTIADLDGLGAIEINGITLVALGAEPVTRNGRRAWRVFVAGQQLFIVEQSGDVGSGGATLRIEGPTLGTGGSIEIKDFTNGQLGLTLDTVNRVTGLTCSAPLIERHATTLTVSLAAPAQTNERLLLSVGAAFSANLRLVTGAEELSFNSDGTLNVAIAAGQSTLVFSLLSRGDVDVDANIELSAALLNAAGNPSGAAASINIVFDANEELPSIRTIVGDLQIQDFDPGQAGTQPHFDGLNNRLTTGNALAIQDLLHGSAGNDTISGGAKGDILRGNGGDDVIYADIVVDIQAAIAAGAVGAGPAGPLNFSGASNNDILSGNAGNDTLVGSLGADVLSGGAGDDLLIAGQGNDYLSGDGEINVETADFTFNWVFAQNVQTGGYSFSLTGDGAQVSEAPGGADTLHAGGGNDYVIGGAGNDTIYGEEGDDLLLGTEGLDTLLGGKGHDFIRGDHIAATGNAATGGADFIDGGDDDDDLFGEEGADLLFGGAGNDFLYGDQYSRVLDPAQVYSGDDYLDGEDGDDHVVGDGGSDHLFGGTGNDELDGDYTDTPTERQGDDYLAGGDGNDVLRGHGGADILLGGAGMDQLVGDFITTASVAQAADYLDGGAGNDVLAGGGRNDYLFGGSGDDQLFGDFGAADTESQGDDYLDGGEGDDLLVGEGGADTLLGGKGNDTLAGEADSTPASEHDDDYLDGGEGDDILIGEGGADTLIGGLGNDTLAGESASTPVAAHGDDHLDGGEGNDILRGEGGADTLLGGAGNDALYGESTGTLASVHGNDFLDGGAGSDVLNGAGGADSLHGGSGDDQLNGGAGDDSLFGGTGNDYMRGSDGADTLDGGDGVDSLYGDAGDDRLSGGEGRDDLNGGDGNDTLFGQGGADYFEGRLGNDIISGGAGDDELAGGEGADDLSGGAGRDRLWGSVGDDTYRFGFGSGVDLISDEAGIDRIEFDANVSPSTVTLIRASSQGGDSLAIVLEGGQDQLLIDRYYQPDSGRVIEKIQFTDGTIWNTAAIASRVIDQSGSADSVAGSASDDTFVVDNVGDSISNPGDGTDHVVASISFTLSTDLEDLTLTGQLAISGTGNKLANTITGNSASNALDGNGGTDTLIGGLGDDSYYLGDEQEEDTVVEATDEGYDAVVTYGSVTLAANVEALTYAGAGNHVLTGNELNNVIDASSAGLSVRKQLRLDGGGGADVMLGAVGTNTYVVDNALDVVVSTEGNADTVEAAVHYMLPVNVSDLTLTGTAVISGTGNLADNRLDGSQNTASNTLAGGWGNDVYVIDPLDVIVEEAGAGFDAVEAAFSYTLQSNVENLILFGGDATTGTGNSDANTLDGSQNDASNALFGSFGDDTYILGYHDLLGEVDTATEFAGEGMDTIVSGDAYAQYVLSANIENGTARYFSVTIVGNALNNTLFAEGDGAASILIGGDGDDQLSDFAGLSVLRGGHGSDTYRVGNDPSVWSTFIKDTDGGSAQDDGIDVVEFDPAVTPASVVFGRNSNLVDLLVTQISGRQFSVAGFFADGSARDRIEQFRFADGTVLTADQVAANLIIAGTAGPDVLNAPASGADLIGLGGNDSLNGSAGNDLLDGGPGADTMAGGTGNDLYRVDSLGDVINETSDDGVDTIESEISYILGANVENLTLLGAANINGTGNAAKNVLLGNAGTNVLDGGDGFDTLDGGEGLDTLIGGLGNDLYRVDESGDVIIETSDQWIDSVEARTSYTLPDNVEDLFLLEGGAFTGAGNELDNFIKGNSSNNILDGGLGADSMMGGAGDDTYLVDDTSDSNINDWAGDFVLEDPSEGTDTVIASVSWKLDTYQELENLTLVGSANLAGTGNQLANILIGNAGNNTLTAGAGDDLLDGQAGSDTMRGQQGNDTYIVDSTSDVVTENSGQGTDTVQSYVNWTLGSNIENLVLLGSSITGTGNASANQITGNNINNTLNGGSGADTLIGGAGNDTYVVDVSGDIVTEAASQGTDLVKSAITYSLGSNVEHLTLTGTTAINGTGNTLDNVLTGNAVNNTLNGGAGNDTLDGAAGTDTMSGGAGNDIYYVDIAADVTTENANEGMDLINSAATRTLAANIELLFLTGTSAINGTGNSLANLLRGNSVNNTLIGGGGTDILEGGAGNDTLSNTTGNTLLSGGAGTDTLTGGSNNDLLIGGLGNDALTTGAGADIIAFNKGDGQDTVAISTAKDNTLSIGGGARYADLLFTKNGNDLVLKVGATDQVTLTGYYANTANRSVNRLQIVIEGTADYVPGSSDVTKKNKIETFNFDGLVSAFDAARTANPSLTSWALSGSLAAQFLSGSDTAALGGDLAYRYARLGSLSDISFSPAISILSTASFGTAAQTLQPLTGLQDSTPRLN
jgi:Ca2+-binding RTX toxin-like protein